MVRALRWFLGIFFLLIFIGSMVESSKPPEKPLTPEEIAEKEKNEREFQRAVAAVRALKYSTNNPATFELVDATLTEKGMLCVLFRGANAYGGIVTNRIVLSEKVTSPSAEAWNQHCAGKTGRDMTNVKYAVR